MADPCTKFEASLAVAEILHEVQNFKTGRLTLTTPLSGKIIHRQGRTCVGSCSAQPLVCPLKIHTKKFLSSPFASFDCLSSPIPTRQQVRKRADLVDGHSSCSGDRADSVDEHLAAGMRRVFRVPDWSVGARPIDMQVKRVRQHHVT